MAWFGLSWAAPRAPGGRGGGGVLRGPLNGQRAPLRPSRRRPLHHNQREDSCSPRRRPVVGLLPHRSRNQLSLLSTLSLSTLLGSRRRTWCGPYALCLPPYLRRNGPLEWVLHTFYFEGRNFSCHLEARKSRGFFFQTYFVIFFGVALDPICINTGRLGHTEPNLRHCKWGSRVNRHFHFVKFFFFLLFRKVS